MVERATRWMLRTRRSPIDVAGTVAKLRPGIDEVSRLAPGLLVGADLADYEAVTAELVAAGVPADLADRDASLDVAPGMLDVVDATMDLGVPVADAAFVYFQMADRLPLGWLRRRVNALPREDRWSSLARSALRDDPGPGPPRPRRRGAGPRRARPHSRAAPGRLDDHQPGRGRPMPRWCWPTSPAARATWPRCRWPSRGPQPRAPGRLPLAAAREGLGRGVLETVGHLGVLVLGVRLDVAAHGVGTQGVDEGVGEAVGVVGALPRPPGLAVERRTELQHVVAGRVSVRAGGRQTCAGSHDERVTVSPFRSTEAV